MSGVFFNEPEADVGEVLNADPVAPEGYVTRRVTFANGKAYLACNVCSAPLSVPRAGVEVEGGPRVHCAKCGWSFHMVKSQATRGAVSAAPPAPEPPAPPAADPRASGGIVVPREPSPPGDYHRFLASKAQVGTACGFEPTFLPAVMHDTQRFLAEWDVRSGRGAVFAGTGLGKTGVQLVTAENTVRHCNRPYLLLTPLAVAAQTVRAAAMFGVDAVRSRDGTFPPGARVVVAHYDALHKFDPAAFCGAGADESGCLKDFDSDRSGAVTEFFRTLPFRHLYSAVPAPNDYVELGTSAEVLGELGRQDMLSRFFRADNGTTHGFRHKFGAHVRDRYRFLGHAEREFWRWVVSWSRCCRTPSDLGFDDARFELPALEEEEHVVRTPTQAGRLFNVPALSLREQQAERRRTIPERCEKAAALVAHDRPAVVWCHLNEEGDRLEDLIPGARQVKGSMRDEEKEEVFDAFTSGQLLKLVTKPVIASWGLNWQHCAHAVTFGSHSYEMYHQLVRRFWRFGQTRRVKVDIVTSEGECGVVANLARKARKAERMLGELVRLMSDAAGIARVGYGSREVEVPAWL